MTVTRARAVLLVIVLVYFILGTLFATTTPAWQAPDEPAHYNYVRYVAEHGQFPVLHPGDYPHAYLEEIKTAKFPPEMNIDAIRYEFHQPPLYYALAAPWFILTAGNLFLLRLFSVLLGAGIILLAYKITALIFPDDLRLALGATAFVAFLPQHLVTVSQVGNDVLAELLLAATLYGLVRWIMTPDEFSRPAARVKKLGLGILLGLILITKTTAYIALPVAAIVLLWSWMHARREGHLTIRSVTMDLLLIAAPALAVAPPWYVRDVWAYGWPDFLGLIRHDAIVVGQLRTVDYLQLHGWHSYLTRLVEFTFKSFWGVFGWLSAFMDSRVYFALAMMSMLVLVGLIVHERSARHGPPLRIEQRRALRLLAFSGLLTPILYAWYNVQFVQHQGRYWFTALIPIAVAFALGWDEVSKRERSLLYAGLLLACCGGLAVWGVLSGVGLPKWPIAIAGGIAVALAARRALPRAFDRLVFALPFAALPFLGLYALYGVILPQLAR